MANSGIISMFGARVPKDTTPLNAHFFCIKHRITTPEWSMAEHFWAVADELWGDKLARNPWAEKMIEDYFANDYLGVAGCASSGKSYLFAAVGIVEWLSAPQETMVIFTSTSLPAARLRIWGDVVKLWDSLPSPGGPGKLVDSRGIIRFAPDGRKFKGSEKNSLLLVPCGEGEERKAVRKLIGFKNKRVLLFCDEMPDLVPGIYKAATGNLAANARAGMFKMVGLGNPASKLDPFGRFMEPKDGWHSVGVEKREWKTKFGLAIRLDVQDSPCLGLATIPKGWEHLPTTKSVEEDRHKQDDNEWWRFSRAWFPPQGELNACYTEDELMLACELFPHKWSGTPIKCASLDPAYKHGGDRIVATIGQVGPTDQGKVVLDVVEAVNFPVPGDGPALIEMVDAFRSLCERHGIDPYHTAIDSTGGGSLIADAINLTWSNAVLRVEFGGAPSARPAGLTKRRANEIYDYRVAELWLTSKAYFQAEQIWNLPDQARVEMTKRKTKSVKGGRFTKQGVEAKKDMKKRGMPSPDYADSFFVLVELARTRMGFRLDSAHALPYGVTPTSWEDAVAETTLFNPDAHLETVEAV